MFVHLKIPFELRLKLDEQQESKSIFGTKQVNTLRTTKNEND